ncbi:MAG: hypothetical protein GEU82_01315 [Luteitalea sp.]|nr:hypothetical protein [Luteitalea sp.]
MYVTAQRPSGVLLQLLPVLVAPLEYTEHQRVEIGLRLRHGGKDSGKADRDNEKALQSSSGR